MTEKTSPLQRRIKKDILAQAQRVRIESPPGWYAVCADEVKELLGDWTLASKFVPELKEADDGIWLENLDFRNMIELPLRLLTAADVLWVLSSRHVGSFGELIAFFEDFPWELYLPAGTAVHVKVDSFRSKLFHEGKIEELINAGLQKAGFQVARGDSMFRLVCEQVENRHTIYLSLAGERLFRRHYKEVLQHAAPLQEHLAAAALRWAAKLQESSWKADLLAIPFAGTGTFYMEELLRRGCAQAFSWRDYAVAHLVCLPKASWTQIRKRLTARAPAPVPPSCLYEMDTTVAAGLEQNLLSFRQKLADPGPDPLTICADVLTQHLPAAKIWLPLNPPYGIRLEQGGRETVRFYRELATWLLRQKGSELRGFVLIADSESLHAFQNTLPPGAVQGVHSFSQGGQHIRCVAFRMGKIEDMK